MSTSTPSVAPSVSRFMITALMGRITDPVIAKSATSVTSTITSTAQGRCAAKLVR